LKYQPRTSKPDVLAIPRPEYQQGNWRPVSVPVRYGLAAGRAFDFRIQISDFKAGIPDFESRVQGDQFRARFLALSKRAM
jgi:hypothetical protein